MSLCVYHKTISAMNRQVKHVELYEHVVHVLYMFMY